MGKHYKTTAEQKAARKTNKDKKCRETAESTGITCGREHKRGSGRDLWISPRTG